MSAASVHWAPLLAACAALVTGCLGEATPVNGLEAGRSPDSLDKSCPTVAAGRVSARRLNNEEYANTVRDLLFLDASVQPARDFPADLYSTTRFDNDATLLDLSPERAEAYFKAANTLATAAMAQSRAKLVTCDLAAGRTCAAQTLSALATRAFRRPASQAEVDGLLAVYDASASAGASAALQRSIQAVLLSPSFLFVTSGDADGVTTGTHVLNGYELASRLSYFLWRSMPDDALFAAAGRGELAEAATLRTQVERMLDDPRASLAVGFPRQWLSLGELAGKAVDPTAYPGFDAALRADLVAETEAFFGHLVKQRRPPSELFTAPYSFHNARLAAHYRGAPVTGTALQQVALPADGTRAGIFSHASVLALSAGSPVRTSPTVRGKWVLDRFLCAEPPPPPADIPKLGDTPGTSEGTIKSKLAAHRSSASCSGCHQLMDPIGLGLESFDVVGRWRTQYEDGSAIDPTGAFPDGTQVSGAADVLRYLGSKPEVSACFAKKLMSYALARATTVSDECTAFSIAEQTFASDRSLTDLIVAIGLTRQFRANEQEASP